MFNRKDYYLANPHKVIERRNQQKKYYLINRLKIIIKSNSFIQVERTKVFDMLGCKCNVCGYSDKRALQIDHINGGGSQEIKKLGNSQKYYRHVLANIEHYQILCANCNQIKRVECNESKKRWID